MGYGLITAYDKAYLMGSWSIWHSPTKKRLIYFFSDKNASCKKSYTPCYASVIIPKGSYSSVRDG